MRQKKLSTGRAVERDVFSDVDCQSKGSTGFNAIQVQDFSAVQRREIARFSDLTHEFTQNLMSKSSQCCMIEGVECQPAEGRAHSEHSLVDIASQVASCQQRCAKAVNGSFRERKLGAHLCQRNWASFFGDERA